MSFRYRKVRRLQYELLLIYVLHSIEALQRDLDSAVEAFRGMRRHNGCPKLAPVFADPPSFSLKLAIKRRLTKGFCWKPRLPIEICVKAREMLTYYLIAGVALLYVRHRCSSL